MRHLLSVIFFLITTSPLFSGIETDLERCLKDCYGLSDSEVGIVNERLSRCIDTPEDIKIIENFILISQTLPQTPPTQTADDDALVAAPETHQLLVENDHVRILWTFTRPGEFVPMHSHTLPQVMIILQSSSFLCTLQDGSQEIYKEPKGVYFYEPYFSEAYQNIGEEEWQAMLFEIKPCS